MKRTVRTIISMLLMLAILAQSLPLALAADLFNGSDIPGFEENIGDN